MSVWMIHEVTEENVELLSKLPYKELLIWDDAVLSQMDAIRKLVNHKHILAVSTNVANVATEQRKTMPKIMYEPTPISHKRWHEQRIATPFMTWDDIRELLSDCPNLHIAAHGYNHTRPSKDLRTGTKEILEECYKIEQDFINNLSVKPDTYVYPYNEKSFWSEAIIKHKFGWRTFAGERLDAKKLFAGLIRYEVLS